MKCIFELAQINLEITKEALETYYYTGQISLKIKEQVCYFRENKHNIKSNKYIM